MSRKVFHKVTLSIQKPVEKILDESVAQNRQQIKDMVPSEQLGSAKQVIEVIAIMPGDGVKPVKD